MKQIVCLLMLGLVLISCSKEDTSIETNTEANLIAKGFDFNSLGNYQGTYVGTGTSERGQVIVNITETAARAEVILSDGQSLKFEAEKKAFSNFAEQSILFSGAAGTFQFQVEADGSNPVVSQVDLNNIAGNIVVAKSTSTTTIRSITGTYGCDDCDGHPVFSNPDMQETLVWNLVFQGDGTGLDIVTAQVSAGTRTFVMEGAQAAPYAIVGDMVYCDIDGDFRFGDLGLVSWSAAHMFNSKEACESVIGTWNFSSANYEFDGWIRSDSGCNPGDDDGDDDDLPYCNDAETKVTVCHGGNSICVSVSSLNAHLAHGDSLGSCD